MRRTLILFAALLALSVAGMLAAHIALSREQYEVSLVETARFGDSSAANGLTVTVNAHLARRLTWDTAHTFGRQTLTDFSFSSKQLDLSGRYSGDAIAIYIASDFSASSSGGNLLGGSDGMSAMPYEFTILSDMLRDVASRAQNGVRYSETVRLNDYFEYYPVYADFNRLPVAGKYYFLHVNDGMPYVSQVADDEEVLAAFSEYFMLKVPDRHEITVGIYKDSAGNVVEVSTSQGAPVQLWASGVEHERGIYFAPHIEGADDFSGIRGGFGICLLPAATFTHDGSELTTLDYRNLRTVYPLDESAQIAELSLSADGQSLNLLTIESGTLTLTVIDIETMTERQKLPLLDNMDDTWLHSAQYREGFMFALAGDSRFALAQIGADGNYAVALLGASDNALLYEDVLERGYLRWFTPVAAWSGEKLALITPAPRYELTGDYSYISDTCGFTVEIHGTGGLLYKGVYASSLDALAQTDDYDGICRLVDSGGLAADW